MSCFVDPCDGFICDERVSECQIYEPSGDPFCSPVCGPDSCPVGQQCFITRPSSCATEPCPGILNCDSCMSQMYNVTITIINYLAMGQVSRYLIIHGILSGPSFMKLVTKAYNVCASYAACPEGVSTVFCIVDPCLFATCEVEGAECVADYCGGCNDRWYLGLQEVTSLCSGMLPCLAEIFHVQISASKCVDSIGLLELMEVLYCQSFISVFFVSALNFKCYTVILFVRQSVCMIV